MAEPTKELAVMRVGNDIYVEMECADISGETGFDQPDVEPPLQDPNEGVTLTVTRGVQGVTPHLAETIMTRLRTGIYAYTVPGSVNDPAGLYMIELRAYHGGRITASQFYSAYKLVP